MSTNQAHRPALLHRTLTLDTAAGDDVAQRIPAIISTEYPVARDGYLEILAHTPDAVDLARAPLPLLEQHDAGALNIGIVENLRLDGAALRGDVVLGQSARACELWPDIRAGIVRSLSVGYVAHEQSAIAYEGGPAVLVTRWEPFETSVVSVPADPGASLYRSITMTDQNTTAVEAPAAAPAPALTANASPEVSAERSRGAAIQALAARYRSNVANVDDIALQAIADGVAVEDFRTNLLNLLAAADRAAGGHLNHRSMDVTEWPRVGRSRDFIQAASDALLLRAGLTLRKPHAAARDLRGMTVLDMARACLSQSGRTHVGELPHAVFRAAMSTSDFPALLGDTLNKALRNGMENEQATHRQWCVVSAASDFRAQSRVILGSAPDLEQVAELGEYTNGVLAEDKTTLVPVKFGRIVSLSWESTLADNLGAFVGLGRSLGQAAMRVEADSIYGSLKSASLAGPNLADGIALFDSTRNNTVTAVTGTGKPLTAAALGAARAKLRRQVNVGGGLLNLTPRTLIVAPERETEAEILVASSTTHTAIAGAEAATPAWLSALTVIAEPRLSDPDVFYLVADSEAIGTGEIAIVDDSPSFEEIIEPRQDALSWKVRHAFAAGFTDFRGIVKATLSAS
ncbi:MAG: Mu-like prophage major head subunit gpT family protein [Rudaea sp.]|uniref:phage major capsid protein n=1 Tax=Rudaea sp. TaxID=2136325 RepID=UPI0039E40F31